MSLFGSSAAGVARVRNGAEESNDLVKIRLQPVIAREKNDLKINVTAREREREGKDGLIDYLCMRISSNMA